MRMPEGNGLLGRAGVIVAARTDSTRLPGKALRPLGGRPMILFLLDRLRDSSECDTIVLATTERATDDQLAVVVAEAGFPVFRGACDDVVDRYVRAAAAYDLDYVVRVTGDCPFVNAESLDYCMRRARALAPFDLASTKGLFPVGIDYEIYAAATMRAVHESGAPDPEDREHLTLFLYRNESRFHVVRLEPSPEWRTASTFTVDTAEDYQRAESIVARSGPGVTIAELAAAAA